MEYFGQFPTIKYSFDPDNYDFYVVRNIFARTKILDEVLSNSVIYYPYSVKESDMIESIAHKYYGDAKRHWIVMFSNQILDPYFDFPLTNQNLENNIISKYGSVANAQATLHHVKQSVLSTTNKGGVVENSYANTTLEAAYTYDFGSNQVQSITLPSIPFPTVPGAVETVTLADGTEVTRTTTLYAVSCYDYELDLNEERRQIRLIDKSFAPILETQLKALLS